MSVRRGWVLALPGVAALLCGFTPPPQWLPITARWCLAPDRCIALEVADTPEKQSKGLQLRPALAPLRGMWFPYNPPSLARFWMHRTPEPLDMVFVRNGRVIAIEPAAAPCMRLPCPSYGPDEPVDGLLELAAGQSNQLGLRVGSPLRVELLRSFGPTAPAPD